MSRRTARRAPARVTLARAGTASTARPGAADASTARPDFADASTARLGAAGSGAARQGSGSRSGADTTGGSGTGSAAPSEVARFLDRVAAWVLLVGGAIGLAAAFALIVEKLALLADPDHIPLCSIDPVLSCGSIMRTAQAEVFGFPNPLLGLVGFAVVVTTGAAAVGGVRFPRWWWLALNAGALAGVLLVHWLIHQSLVVIGALCPYCMVVWAVTVPVFWYVTARNLADGTLPAPPRVARLLTTYHGVVVTVWLLAIAVAVTVRFRDHWTTVL